MGMSEIEMDIKEETMDLCRITEILECKLKSCLEADFDSVDSGEAGEITDMIKDMYQSKKYAVEACYYKKLMEKAEEEGEEGGFETKMYFPVDGMPIRRNAGMGGMNRWDPMEGAADRIRPMEGQDGLSRGRGVDRVERQPRSPRGPEGSGRYGFSFDGYMDAKEMYPGSTQEHKKMRLDTLNQELDDLVEMGKEVVREMSPEEKQVWKGKISKVLNL